MADRLEIQQRFVMEGRFIALPLGFTDESLPIPADDSRITAFVETDNRKRFYGATTGDHCHLFCGGARGVCGGAFDLGILDQVQEIVAIAVVQTKRHRGIHERDSVICVGNHVTGSVICRFDSCYPGDTVQEPFYDQPCLQTIVEWDCQVHDAFISSDKQQYVCLCGDGIRTLDLITLDTCHHGIDLSNASLRCWLQADGHRYFVDGAETLHPYEAACSLVTPSLNIPADASLACCWGDKIVVTTAPGEIHLVDPACGSTSRVGGAPLPDLQCMAALRDGRLYGVCGSEIGFFFRMDLKTGDCEALGAIATTFGTKRYGFEFSKMIVGSDGEIYMLENDRGGHLWIYFPPQPNL